MHNFFFHFSFFSNHTNDLEIHSRHGLSAHNNGFWFFHPQTLIFVFWKKSLIYSLKSKILNSFIFFHFFFPNCRISQNHYYSLLDLIKEMILHTQDVFISRLDQKIHFDEKKFQIFISLPNSLRITSKRILKRWFFTIENFFSASSRNVSIGRMKNPRSFLILNRGRRTKSRKLFWMVHIVIRMFIKDFRVTMPW